MKIHVIGYPGDIAGASTELGHVLRLWRTAGWEVVCTPTWSAPPAWRERLDRWGVTTRLVDKPGRLPVIDDAVVVSFCNVQFLASAAPLVKAGLPIVWVPCMSYLFSSERRALNRYGPFTRYVFHSQYQRAAVGGQLQALGVEPQRFAVIRGAFCLDDWPYCPRAHAPDSEFFIGRLSRSDRRKFPADLWTIYEPIPRRRARVMGVTDPIARYLGPAPDWAETLPPKAEPADRFLAGLHAMVMPGGEAVENWPRVGLEAMAAGVPIIADGTGGWPEMIDHGRTGYLCRSPGEFAEHAALLAENESLRLAIAARARTALETDLADPDLLIAAWQRVFDGL